ncbi:hypothetical protein [Flavobacterium sp. LHD-85]|uniref:hypothetical protein n=1 Tax=Flavobacterium sp. LHD-85 TaxID=3071410 RepID=UPI0027E19043|nr:hypothetical protein [Flavobacterium sp. LHD-85]MDQ6528927.1 hypothetical protein [Flavobacterium sp. LHD-85]
MKKNKISFETRFWAGFETTNLFETVEAFFDYAHLDYYKQTLSEGVIYSYKGKIYRRDNLSQIFVFYLAIRSFLKVCFLLRAKSKKWKVKESEKNKSVLHLASLSKEEYENPLLYLKKHFTGKP